MNSRTIKDSDPERENRISTADQLQELQETITRLRQENSDILTSDQELRGYIREKTNQLLSVMGTLALEPEELDDETLINVDPIGIVTDSFRQVLEHLQETNENLSLAKDELQAIFDSAGAGILVVDSQMRLNTFNRKSQELFFPDNTNAIGQDFRSIICGPSNHPEVCIFDQVIETQWVVEQTDFVTNDRHYHVIGTPIKNKDDVISYVVLVYTDITERKKSEQTLRDAEARMASILNSTQAGIMLIDPESHQIIFANQATAEMTGISQAELQGQICHSVICPKQQGRCPITDEKQSIDKAECELITRDGRLVPIIKTVSKLEIDGKTHLLESFIDISERKETERKLRESEERYRTLYSTMQEGVAQHRFIYDDDGQPCDYEIIDVNHSFELIIGRKRDQVIGRLASEIYPLVDGKPACLDILSKIMSSGESSNFEFEFKDIGRTLRISAAPLAPGHFATVFEDITQRKQDEEKIERLAYFDNLTGLPNRVLMRDRLGQMVVRAKRNSCRIGLFFLDLDHFKRVNDTLGHDKGDQLLKVIADRLDKVLRSCDSISRLGGDEFVILVDDIKDRDDAALIACKILESLAQPVILERKEVFITTSVGIAMFPEDGVDPDTLLKNADAAMYQSKDKGRNTYRFYSSEMNAQALEKLLLANDLRKALKRNEFHLAYQPQIDLSHGQMTGVEALLRWQHPDLGNISPVQFIPLAEETGLILSIGRWVLETACRQAYEIQQSCGTPFRVAVNLSTKQFQDPNLVTSIREILHETGLEAQFLELEITESILMENVENAQKTLHELKDMGLKLAIDDFGTGYSSLSYLRHFPIDRLKVDKSFVQRITTHPDDAAITEAIIVMAHTIGIRVVAEGVELKTELDFLREKKCDEVQGFYFSRPLRTEQLVERIQDPCPTNPFCFFNS